MTEAVGAYIILTAFINLMWWLACAEIAGIYGLCLCNPKWIYNHTTTNWFGTICLTVLANVAFGPAALFYWFYKLCTVGRK